MKTISRILIATVALTIAAVPMAQARDGYSGPYRGQHSQQQRQMYKPQPPRAYYPQRPQTHYKKSAPRAKYYPGQRYSNWNRAPHVRDYQRYGLRRPAAGQRWVKVDNDFLLISLATGLIVGAFAAGR